jgi:catechol 2,3-dioxygenase-like lactoylglutathione lyase family enzyme
MATPSVARLGHVGLHVQDLEKEKAFYRDIIGLTVTDEDPELGMVFMSARPEEEHHELMLCAGRNVGAEARVVQQVSFRCNSLEDVLGFYRRFKERGVKFDVILSHGNGSAFTSTIPKATAARLTGTPGLRPSSRMGKCWTWKSRRPS